MTTLLPPGTAALVESQGNLRFPEPNGDVLPMPALASVVKVWLVNTTADIGLKLRRAPLTTVRRW